MSDEHGFLTPTDRSFLQGETEYDSKQGRYKRRQSIRERTRGAYLDFTLLYDHLDDEERTKIFEPLADGVYHPQAVPWREGDPPARFQRARALKDGISSAIAFSYLGLRPIPVSFTELVEAAVFNTERGRDRVVDVSLDIEDKDPLHAIESAIAKLQAGSIDDLSYTESRLVMDFMMDPEGYHPTAAREEAIERLNEIGPFAIGSDGDSSEAVDNEPR